MQQWEEMNRAAELAIKRRDEQKLLAIDCPTCGSNWFEQARFYRLKADHMVISGQEVPPVEPGLPAFVLLRCVHCSKLLKPHMQGETTFGIDVASKAFNDFMDTCEGKFDKRKDQTEDKEKIMMLEEKMKRLEKVINALQSKEQ